MNTRMHAITLFLHFQCCALKSKGKGASESYLFVKVIPLLGFTGGPRGQFHLKRGEAHSGQRETPSRDHLGQKA